MNNNADGAVRKRISALDVFVILLMVLCIAGMIVRVSVGREGVMPEGTPKKGSYALSFEISGQRSSLGSELSQGEVFYSEDGKVFGTLTDQVSVTPAKIYSVDDEGKYILGYSSSDGGEGGLVDIRGTMTVEGYQVEYGFLAGGKIFASPNERLTLHTDTSTVTVKVTDVAKIGD
ncbi:MAG: hypothetical protein IKN38_01640 [Clostridia bacterium]|nr:hypothetical protein [Clostridia bacterium]